MLRLKANLEALNQWSIVGLSLLFSGLFTLLFGEPPLTHFPDENEYVNLANLALTGDFNFVLGRFIRSPAYPLILSILKLVFGSLWLEAALLFNWLMQGLATLGIIQLARLLFGNVEASASGILFALYVP